MVLCLEDMISVNKVYSGYLDNGIPKTPLMISLVYFHISSW